MSTLAYPSAPCAPVLTAHIKLATTPAQIAGARQLRQQVFCQEQGLFDGDDEDAVDTTALTLVAVSSAGGGVAGNVIGTVRIHHAGNDVWWGSRLAVDRSARRQAAVGSGLIRLAVGVARARGCQSFLAHVQQQNVPMFERLHWQALEAMDLHGVPHSLMQAQLARYAALADAAAGFYCVREAL